MDTSPATVEAALAGTPTNRTGGLSPAAREALAAGIPPETDRAYRRHWAQFTAWCATAGRPPMPTDGDALTEYVTHLIRTPRPSTGRPYAPSSIEGAMAAVAVAHDAAELPKPSTAGARRVLRGYERQLKDTPGRGRARRAAAATPEKLRAMTAALPDTAAGRRDRALLLIGFALAARRSEAASLSWEDLTFVREGIEVELWRPKTNHDGPYGIPYGSYPGTCPVRALAAWQATLAERHHRPRGGPLFVRIDRHDRINPPMRRYGRPIGDPHGRMTGEAISEAVTRAAARAGLTRPDELLPHLPPRWSGHSLRRGFANAARDAGKDIIETARGGGWVDGSKALADYFDQAGIWHETNPLFGIGL